ncbi:hypothetical protein SAMN04244572_02497 [Azotobacter beijerinckii]|uniref:Uncharacterized protein n=1 Tax=Azotobacter beijerinckii TaxID=170623 RepID=A0A1H6VMW0_9GAMM|nr:hypothetical protein [Azotobacter beijerinckii]SEJ03067.1 hypothetical protein SAMN04244572_02497 [Azotobacter beijerinckii]
MIGPSPFVPAAVASQPLHYDWDSWDPYSLLGSPDEETVGLLEQVSDRAQIAYAIGCAEWVAQCLGERLETDRPLLYIEAFWAFEMDQRIASPAETVEAEWQGRILAPMDLALMTVLNTYYTSADGNGALEAAFAECIPRHLLDDRQAFFAWRKAVLARLLAHYPRQEDDPWGAPVPREALDPARPLTPEAQEHYVADFFSRLSPGANPLIRYGEHDNSVP